MVSEFEKVLRYGRKEKKLTQYDVAEIAGLNTTIIAKLESGLFIPLENETLFKIAAAVGADPGMLMAMYRSEFRSELRQQKNYSLNPQDPQAEKEPGNHNLINEDRDIDNSENPLAIELNKLGKEILTMPVDLQKILIEGIRMLVQGACLHSSY